MKVLEIIKQYVAERIEMSVSNEEDYSNTEVHQQTVLYKKNSSLGAWLPYTSSGNVTVCVMCTRFLCIVAEKPWARK